MYRFFATIRAGGRAGNPPFPIPLLHSPLRSSSSSSAFCLDPHLHSADLMEEKGFRGLPICNCNRRTGNMTGERNLRMHRFYPSFPFSFPFLRSSLLLPVSTVSLTPLSSWNCSSEMQEILRALEAAAVVERKRAGKQIPHLQNDRRGESARTRGSTLACACTSLCSTLPSFLPSVVPRTHSSRPHFQATLRVAEQVSFPGA